MEKKSIDELIAEETSNRLDEMQSKDYEFPKKMSKLDYIIIAILCGISLALIIACMVGGIS